MAGGNVLECRNCPYGDEDFKKRMYWYEKIVQGSVK